jgi:hypothetical protein
MTSAGRLEELYPYFSVCFSFIILRTAIVYGTWHRLRFFSDPSPDRIIYWSNYALKKLIGRTGLIIYWYGLGIMFLLIGSIGLFRGLMKFFGIP